LHFFFDLIHTKKNFNNASFFFETFFQLQAATSQNENNASIKSYLIFVADNTAIQIENVNHWCKNLQKPIIGGIFPEIIFKGERKNSGIILFALPFFKKTNTIDLEQSKEDIEQQINLFGKDISENINSIFLITYSLGKNKNILIDSIYNYFGVNISYIVGGAGSLSFQSKSCVISNQGIQQQIAVIGFS
jgi:hypothetical protein